ncbi:MAG TPA: hypothetical protein VEI97_10530 [bacterium]|nr:hypothetical protein [bacterium]
MLQGLGSYPMYDAVGQLYGGQQAGAASSNPTMQRLFNRLMSEGAGTYGAPSGGGGGASVTNYNNSFGGATNNYTYKTHAPQTNTFGGPTYNGVPMPSPGGWTPPALPVDDGSQDRSGMVFNQPGGGGQQGGGGPQGPSGGGGGAAPPPPRWDPRIPTGHGDYTGGTPIFGNPGYSNPYFNNGPSQKPGGNHWDNRTGQWGNL